MLIHGRLHMLYIFSVFLGILVQRYDTLAVPQAGLCYPSQMLSIFLLLLKARQVKYQFTISANV